MSYTGNTTGVAYIDVVNPTSVNVTEKVKAVQKHAMWQVHNSYTSAVTVEVKNFRLHTTQGNSTPLVEVDMLSNPSGTIGPGGHALILLKVDFPEGIYDYDVYVNGSQATDPQLDI